MSRTVALRSSAILACSVAILCCSVVASAQDGFAPGANQTVWTVALQGDGKILVGGVFTGLGGGTGATTRQHIGRLNADGTVDLSFNAGANGDVYAVAVQPDGKILVGGNFNTLGVAGVGTGVVPRNHIGRFNSDGTVDSSFNPGANLNVYALAVQPDGRILVGGDFSTLASGGRIGLGRLNEDGTLDTFNPGVSKTMGAPIVYTLALQPDGKVVVGGYFNGLGGGTGATTRNYIGRVEANGALDTTFNPGANSISGVNALALQVDGKILVGGSFTGLGNGSGTTLRQNVGRLNADGSVDAAFNPGAESQVLTLGVQLDGKILIGGYFKWLGAAGGAGRTVCNYIGRLNVDGSVDGTFNPGAGNVVNAIAQQGDGAIVAGGIFSTVGGGTGVATNRLRLARFATTAAAVQSLTLTGGGTIETWLRSGGGPEVTRVTFEFSFDGSFYSLLGHGSRIAGGWQFTGGPNLPSARRVYLRARGFYGTGFQNGSGSIVEQVVTLNDRAGRRGDFNGGGKADIAVFRPSTGLWFVRYSETGATASLGWGSAGDQPVPSDYDGDGLIDFAVFRPSNGVWYVLKSATGTAESFQWGISSDLPVPGDYDGDGRTDYAIFRPSNGVWYIRYSGSGAVAITQWGSAPDVPVPGDYNADGKTDLAVFRPSTGVWYILISGGGAITFQWGSPNDIAVPGDYDGDGAEDIAVFRPSTGVWYVRSSSSGSVSTLQWGGSTDTPVPGDFDGDGKTDFAVFRPSAGTWYIWFSGTGGFGTLQWGVGTDIPILKRP